MSDLPCPPSRAPSAPATHVRTVGWAAPIISCVVLLSLGVMVVLAYTVHPPDGSQGVIVGLAETLKLLSVAVVSYWMGSSDGSARKDAVIRNSLEDARSNAPSVVVNKLVENGNGASQ